MKLVTAVRILLIILLILNLVMIFSFSNESALESWRTSKEVAKQIAPITVQGYKDKTPTEQNNIVNGMLHGVRKMAHMTEFGTLCALAVLLLQTWKQPYLKSVLFAMIFTAVIASLDELNQFAKHSGRAGKLTDVLIDLLGGAIAAFLVWCLLKAISFILKRIHKKT